MATADIFVGPRALADGVVAGVRGERTGSMCVTFGHSYYSEAASRGGIFEANVGVAGVTHGTALGTTPPLTLYNPPNSGVNLAILKVSAGYVSGTLGAGSIVYATCAQTTTPSTGTALTPICTKLGGIVGQGKAFTGSTISTTPTLIRAAFNIGPMLATSVYQPSLAADVIDGAFIVPPGQCFAVQGVATAGTSPLMIFAIAWEEIPQ
jgi:hypothetical protein